MTKKHYLRNLALALDELKNRFEKEFSIDVIFADQMPDQLTVEDNGKTLGVIKGLNSKPVFYES